MSATISPRSEYWAWKAEVEARGKVRRAARDARIHARRQRVKFMEDKDRQIDKGSFGWKLKTFQATFFFSGRP